jgi:FKBP-type peptidyl-prolyl cis-trans isomerase (trigger factor)
MELLQRGLEAEEVETKLAEIREQSADKTRNRVKGFFVIARIAEDASISVSEQELNGAIATMAMRQGVRPDKLRSELAKQDRLQQMAMTLRDRKAMDHIASQMTHEDVSVDEWKTIQEKS